VRDDLTPAQQAVQASHAAILLGQSLTHDQEHPHLVLIGLSEPDLARACARLEAAAVRHFTFREPDLNDTITAVVTGPVFGAARRQFRRFPEIVDL
jgi:hypothetical protein